MSDAVILIVIDPNSASFVSPAPGSATVPMGNFDPIQMTAVQQPSQPGVSIGIVQPTGAPGTAGYVSGTISVTAPLGTEVDIDFKVFGGVAVPYQICGLVLALIAGAGASQTGSVNFAKHKCEDGTLTLYDAHKVLASYNFYLLIQDKATGFIGLLDPKIITGGS